MVVGVGIGGNMEMACLLAKRAAARDVGTQNPDQRYAAFEKDLLDASHLNYFGSVKYTKYLAEWMQEHCQLPDRRGNVDYWEWEEVSDLFWEVKEEALAGELSASFCVQAQSYAG